MATNNLGKLPMSSEWQFAPEINPFSTPISVIASMASGTQSQDEMRAHSINQLLDQILETIYDSAPTPNINEIDKGALRQEYNRLFNELESLQRAPLVDPLTRLPPEIWTEIIRETAGENSVNPPPTDILLSLTLVSREWNRKIVGTPVLWTNITVGRGEADAHAKLATALYLTEHIEFEITIIGPPYQWEDDLSLLRAHTQRLKKITFQFPGLYYIRDAHNGAAEECIDNLFASLGHLPSLQVLHGPQASRLNLNGVFERCPNLHRIYGTALPLEILQAQNLVPIRACRLEAPWRDIIPRLGDLSYLEELDWAPELGTDIDIGGKYGSSPTLPALRRVASNYVQSPNILVLLKLTERLTWLEFRVEGNWQRLYDFFLLLEDLFHLRDLDLVLGDIKEKFSFPVDRLAKTGVQYLQLSGPYMAFDDAVARNTAFSNQEAIFSVFSTCFPGVGQLELFFIFLGPKAAAYIQSATHLLSLTLFEVEILPGYYDMSIKSPTLAVLNLWLGPLSTHTGPIMECPLISTLGVRDDEGKWDGSRIPHNNVTDLRIRSQKSDLKMSGFNALQKLRLDGAIYTDYSTSAVPILFICEPTMCPLLVELEFDFTLEWDLLFLMLERRNYLPQSQHISRIKTLILPFPLSPGILAPLTEILGGRFTVRPSDQELSIISFMNAYFDANM